MADRRLTHTLHTRVTPEIHAAITRLTDDGDLPEGTVTRKLIRLGLEKLGEVKPRKAKRGAR